MKGKGERRERKGGGGEGKEEFIPQCSLAVDATECSAFYQLVRCAAHVAKCANWSNAPYRQTVFGAY